MITLKEPEYGDYTSLYEARFQPEVVYWADDEDPLLTMHEYADSRLASMQDGSILERIILLNGYPIGTVTARDYIKKTAQCTLGIVIVEPKYWGHGYGTEAMRQFLRLLAELGIQIVILDTYASNKRALHCFRSLGFEKHRVYFASIPGRFVVQMVHRLNRRPKRITHPSASQ